MQQIHTGRIVIIGAGLGALYAALSLAPHPVLIISPEPLGRGASSSWAQGGVAAAMDQADSTAAHAADTVRAGAGTVDEDVARTVTAEAGAHIHYLTSLGTPFDRSPDGSYVMSREAAHSFARVVRVRGDQAGAEIMRALVAEVCKTSSIQVIEGVLADSLITENGRVTGVAVINATTNGSAPCVIRGAAYLLAGGGSGGLYAKTTNPPRIRGQVIGMAARAGAVIADAEFVQFHPTAIDCDDDPVPLATEALRGEGALLINVDGDRFMLTEHPDGELAPRDIVARAIFAQSQAGKRPMLDTRQAIGDRIVTQFPALMETCVRIGVDPVVQAIPVTTAAHYHMGGISTDLHGHSSLENLWACGEAASTGLHGANRLASNGLLEALVFARRCAQSITSDQKQLRPPLPPVVLPDLAGSTGPDPALVQRLRDVMTDHVGVIRNASGLHKALRQIAEIEVAQPDCVSLLNMTATATLIAAAALSRRESRGAHFRTDFPEPNANIARRSQMTLTEAIALRSACLKETL